jgi:DNA-binding MurR/RpiR family transcriptional regulator
MQQMMLPLDADAANGVSQRRSSNLLRRVRHMNKNGTRKSVARTRDGASTSPLEQRLAKAGSNLNSSRRRLLRQILDNSQDAYFLSSRELARHYDVDTATVVRTTQALGYKRYADFLADLRSHFVSRITPYSVMKTAAREHRGMAERIHRSLEMDTRNLEGLREGLDPKRVTELARRIHRARRTVVVGVDFAASLSRLLAYGLVSIGIDARAPEGSVGNLQQNVALLGAKDLLIAISFGRCLRATVESILHAKKRKVPTFGITNSESSPLARFCDSFWLTSIENPSFHGSYVAPLAAINALLVACAHIHPQRSLAVLRYKEQEFRSGTRWYSPDGADGEHAQQGHG